MKKYNGIDTFEKKDIKLPDRTGVTNKGDCGRLLGRDCL